MIQNPSAAGSGVSAENVPVVFSRPHALGDFQIMYTTMENGGVVFKNETKKGVGGTVYALKGSVLYCTADSVYSIVLSVSSGGALVSSGTYKGRYATDYDFKVYQVTG